MVGKMGTERKQYSCGSARGEKFYHRVRRFMLEQEMVRQGEAVIAGVSGGADSLCLFQVLLRLSREMGFVLEAVHVHHGLREAAEADLRFVEDLCREAGVFCTSVRVDAAAMARQWGTGVEEAGRRLRYEAFEERAVKLETELQTTCRIAVAHHREDQAETVLFHICRGTDLRGAGGMRPVQGRIIRPLLQESRGSIEEYLSERGLAWRTDESNEDTSYSRNYLRKEILPRLAAGVHPAAAERIVRFAHACADAERYLEKMTQAAVERCTVPGADPAGTVPVLRISAVRGEDPFMQTRVLYSWLAEVSGTRRDLRAVHIDALQDLCAGRADGQLSMPGGITAVRRGDRLMSAPADTRLPPAVDAGIYPAAEEEYTCRVFAFDGDLSAIPRNEYTKWFDYDKIGMFPVFRTRRPGDTMSLRGQAGDGRQGSGTDDDGCLFSKKLARIMLDSRIPAEIRDRIVLPFAGKEALWIPGVRMGDRWRVSGRTERILAISVQNRGGSVRAGLTEENS